MKNIVRLATLALILTAGLGAGKASAGGPEHIFLCTPSGALGVWEGPQAKDLVAEDGYTEALAVPWHSGTTLVGDYSLTCDYTEAQPPPVQGARYVSRGCAFTSCTFTGPAIGYVTDGGSIVGLDYAPAATELGFYAILGPPYGGYGSVGIP
jgi:hypothetical protein